MDSILILLRDHPPVVANLVVFSLLATAERGFARAGVWLLAGTFIGWLMEFSSTLNGFPFGAYSYHPANYPDDVWLGSVPLFASLSFAALTYFGYSAALTLLSPLRADGSHVRRIDVPGLPTSWSVLLLATLLITWMDLVMDPVTHLGRYWFLGDLYHYDPPGAHFGVPLSNYAGWLMTSFLIVLVNQIADGWMTRAGAPPSPAFDLPLGPLWSIGGQAGTYIMMLVVTLYLMTSAAVPSDTPLGGILVSGSVLTGLYGVFVAVMLRRAFGDLADRSDMSDGSDTADMSDGSDRSDRPDRSDTSDMETLPIHDKTTGEPIAYLAIDRDDAVAAAVERARTAQPAWAALGARQRSRLLKRARRPLVAKRAEILGLLERETGKARLDVVGELMNVCLDIGYYARRAPGWLQPQKVGTRPLYGKRGRINYKPRGIVGIISPWNAPLTLALGDAVPALLAGNAVIIKPSELTPLAVRGAVEALNERLPAGVLQMVIGDGDTGAALVDRSDLVCVTGSPQTGRRVMERASRRLTPVLLELGGKDPMIVLEDADLNRAARAAAWGACMMTGQVCMSVERIYVVDKVAADFKQRLLEQMQSLRTGPREPQTDIDFGPFISAKQVEIVERQIADAVERGGRVLTGGKRIDGESGVIYFEPTLIEADHSMQLMREETFGPVVGVMTVKDADEAVRLANDSDYGLNASVWTRDIERGVALASRLESGSACVNECVVTAGLPELPFGGVKQSGIGTRHGGAEGVRQFCVRQALLIEPRRRKTEMAWFPYSARRARWIERMMGWMFRF